MNSEGNIVRLKGRNRPSFDELAAEISRARSADGVDLDGLNPGQRAMIAARLVTTGMRGVRGMPKTAVTAITAAQWLGIPAQAVSWAFRIRKLATPREIETIESGGRLSIEALGKQLRLGMTPAERIAAKAVPLSQRGKSPERIHRMRLQAELWRCLREGLSALTALPAPRDVAEIVRGAGKSQQIALVDAKLLKTQAWLEEFVDEWTRPRPAPGSRD